MMESPYQGIVDKFKLINAIWEEDRPITSGQFFAIGPGWVKIIDSLISDLINLGWDRRLCQVKEKFGGLRFYIGEGSQEVYDRIYKAEEECLKTCEVCGATENVTVEGSWISARCKDCRSPT